MLLIRDGFIHTMTNAGSFQGDMLIQDGKIIEVGKNILPAGRNVQRIIDADGLQICPGLIDAHVHLDHAFGDMQKNIDTQCDDALASGITTQAIWLPQPGECIIRHGRDDARIREPMRSVHPETMTDADLTNVMKASAETDRRIACEVDSAGMLSRLLKLKQATGAKLVLIHLTGCEEMLDDVAASGSEVILDACVPRSDGYAMAERLMQSGVTVALTSNYPATRLHHLPLCTGLFVRAGMERQAALRAITLDAARLLRIDDVCGSIEAGKRADLTVFDGDPFQLATARVMTVAAGVILQET